VWIFDLVQDADNILRSEAHAQPESGEAPRFRKSLKDRQVREVVEQRGEASATCKVDICFVDYNQSREFFNKVDNGLFVEKIAGRIVGTAKKNHFGGVIDSYPYGTQINVVGVGQQHALNLNIVDAGTDSVHSVSGFRYEDSVAAWFAKCPDDEVDSFVAAISQEDLRNRYFLYRRYPRFEGKLQGVRVAVERGRVWVFICIQEHRCVTAEFVPRG